MKREKYTDLFDTFSCDGKLPLGFERKRPGFLGVERVVLAKGSSASQDRISFIDEVMGLYPGAEVIEMTDTPHSRIDLGEKDPCARVSMGKATLVFGEHKSAVRFSDEEGNACPNYWHFSPYGFCFYGCKYCYLAGTQTYWHSPTVRIFLNLDEIMDKIDKAARKAGRPTAFYLGKLQDGLSLDPLTGYSNVLVPFFADHPWARQVILTKSDEVGNFLELDHKGHTTLSWSLNPPEVSSLFEENAPDIESRIKAMKLCVEHGYPVRAVVMPLIPIPGWEEVYPAFIERLVSEVPVQRLTIGGICSYKNARRLMESRLGKMNEVSSNIDEGSKLDDGRARYGVSLRIKMYSSIIKAARQVRPDMNIALCLEERGVWDAVGLEKSIGECNCVL